MSAMEWIALGALIVNCVAAVIGLTWGVGKVKDEVEDRLKKRLDDLVLAISESELKMERSNGETAKALREKIVQVEFFVRDNYVREKDFDAMIKMFEGRFDRLQDSMDRLSEKLDKNRDG